MNALPNHNVLDDFIKTKVKIPDTHLPRVEWLELESMIGAPKTPISFSINKKAVKIIFLLLIIALVIVGVITLIPIIHNNIQYTIPEQESVQQPVIKPTTIASPTFNSTSIITPVQIDSISLTEHESDSVLKAADKLSAKINSKEKPNVKTGIKNKTPASIEDSVATTEDIIIAPLVDTATHPVISITPPISVDTTHENLDKKGKKGKKNKKNKNQPEIKMGETKPDSIQ